MLPFSINMRDRKLYFLDRDITALSWEPALDVRAILCETPLFEMDMTDETLHTRQTDVPVTFLFHPSFCHSTLLTALLHENGLTAINELLLLHQLESEMESGNPECLRQVIHFTLEAVFHLNEDKPFICKLDTLLLADLLLACYPNAQTILLMPSLEQFLFHILDKYERQAWCEDQFFRYRKLCGLQRIQPKNDLEYIVALWDCSAHILKRIADRQPSLFIQSGDLLADPEATLRKCCAFFGHGPDRISLDAMGYHSKTRGRFLPEDYAGLLREFCDRRPHMIETAHMYRSQLCRERKI